MSPAALPLVRIPVGIVVGRYKADSPWTDFVWRAVAVLPDEPDTKSWTVLRDEGGGTTLFYAGSTMVDLYISETARYRDNLASGCPSIWTVLSPAEGTWPYSVAAATADPAEGEAFTEAGANLVEAVPMPDVLRDQCGILSPKDGCSPTGQCGCCTVIIDDRAVVSCAVPAKNAAGRRVPTRDFPATRRPVTITSTPLRRSPTWEPSPSSSSPTTSPGSRSSSRSR